MGIIGAPEIIIIAVVAGIFFFGKNKIIDWARGIGEAKQAMKEGESGLTKEVKA